MISCSASMNARHLVRCIASLSLDCPFVTMVTTAALSHHAMTVCPLHSGPHRAAAITIGTSSLAVMCHWCIWPAHGNWNQRAPQYVPHPQEPDASDTSATEGLATSGFLNMLTPFQPTLYCHHHSMSDLASLLSLTKCSSFFVAVQSSINLLVKVLPAFTTLQAWPRIPISESSSRFLHAFLPRHPASSDSILSSLSFGSHSSMATVSISTPRKVKQVARASSFSGSGGSPSLVQTLCITTAFHLHSASLAPSVMKLSTL